MNIAKEAIKAYTKQFQNMRFSKAIQQSLNLILIIVSAFMIWKTLMVATQSESPITVVLSGSMEPAYYRGDILFVINFQDDPIIPGDVIIFNLKGQDIPIVHRVIAIQEKEDGEGYILTKGDNNDYDDRILYDEAVPKQLWINKSDVIGKVRGYLPYVGMVSIVMNDNPVAKWILLGTMALFTIIAKDPQS